MNADVRSVTTFDSSILNTPSLTEAISEEDFHGIGIGIGGRYALNKNWSLFGRGEWIKFKSQKVSGPSLSTLDEITFSQDTDVAPSRASLMFGIVFSL
jgi:predicted porin